MATQLAVTQQMRVKITMERSFESFDRVQREQFLKDLERVSGCPRDQFEQASFRPGCIIFEGDLEKEAVLKLLELFAKRDSDDLTESSREFLERYGVKKIEGGVTLRVQILRRKVEPKAELLFVHGWRGDADSFGRLPEFLSSLLGLESRIYSYPTNLWKPKTSPAVEFIAENLDNWLRNNLRSERLGIIAHSMGGIVVRKLLVSQHWRSQPLDAMVKQVTFIASPHNGAVLSALANSIETFKGIQLADLAPNSPLLFALNRDWNGWTKANVPQNCLIRCIVGTLDNVVSVNNARGLDPESVPILNASHSDIIRPIAIDDEVVTTVSRFMVDAGLDESGLHQSREAMPNARN
jgi:PGAP1-like protein